MWLIREVRRVDDVIEEAVKVIRHGPNVIEVRIQEALGKYLAEDVIAPSDYPPFDRAVMDGYAVRSMDTHGASPHSPVLLRVIGFLCVGDYRDVRVGEGEALEICTGAKMPEGADAVVPYEYTRRIGDFVEVYTQVPPYANVSRRGEDVVKGQVVFRRGHRLKPWDLALLASLGIARVKAYRPKAALLCIGSELVEVGSGERGVYNATRFIVEGLLAELGFEVEYLGIVPDDVEAIRRAIEANLDKFDVFFTTGGASVGRPDLTVKAIEGLRPEYIWRGLAIRPGRPTGIAVINGRPVFILSGFPVAAFAGFELFVRPILQRAFNLEFEPRPFVRGILTRRIAKHPGLKALIRCIACLEGDRVLIKPITHGGSGMIGTLANANAYIIAPEDREGYDEGEEVIAYLTQALKPCGSS